MHWKEAKEANTYACDYANEESGVWVLNVEKTWLTAMKVAWICFLTQSVAAILTIVSAWVIPARDSACGIVFVP